MESKPYEVTVTFTVKYWLNENDAEVLSYKTMDKIIQAVGNDILDGWITHNEMDLMRLRPIDEVSWHDTDIVYEESKLERLYGRGGGLVI